MIESIFLGFLVCYKTLDTMLIGLVGRVFATGLGDLGSIPGRIILKTLKNSIWYLLV